MVEFEVRGRVALITINRPEARNAVNAAVASGLEAAVQRLEGEPELWVGVLAGAGPVFSAGADLKEIAAGSAATLATERGGFEGITRLELGLDELCEPGTAVERALGLADRIGANAPLAVQASRDVVLRAMLAPDKEAWEITDAATAAVITGEDFAEGPRAFVEKREPVWTGR